MLGQAELSGGRCWARPGGRTWARGMFLCLRCVFVFSLLCPDSQETAGDWLFFLGKSSLAVAGRRLGALMGGESSSQDLENPRMKAGKVWKPVEKKSYHVSWVPECLGLGTNGPQGHAGLQKAECAEQLHQPLSGNCPHGGPAAQLRAFVGLRRTGFLSGQNANRFPPFFA